MTGPQAFTTVATGIFLSFSPLAVVLGFTPLPAPYFAFLAGSIASYPLLVEIPNRRRFGGAAVLAPRPLNFSL